MRYQGSHLTYAIGRVEPPYVNVYYLQSSIFSNTTTDILINYTYFGSTIDPIGESLRRCAEISYKIDYSFAQNVGGDDLPTIQTVWVGTRNDDQVIPNNKLYPMYWTEY